MLQSIQEYIKKGCCSFGTWSQNMVPTSQALPLRQARLALETLMKRCGKSSRNASDRGQGRLDKRPRQRQGDVRALRRWHRR